MDPPVSGCVLDSFRFNLLDSFTVEIYVLKMKIASKIQANRTTTVRTQWSRVNQSQFIQSSVKFDKFRASWAAILARMDYKRWRNSWHAARRKTISSLQARLRPRLSLVSPFRYFICRTLFHLSFLFASVQRKYVRLDSHWSPRDNRDDGKRNLERIFSVY